MGVMQTVAEVHRPELQLIFKVGDQFRKQLKYLETLSQSFDQGDTDEAIRLAVTLRVLLHEA